MKRTNGRVLMAATALLALVALAAALLLHEELTGAVPPDDPRGMALWLVEHPADWLTAARLTELALDSQPPSRGHAWKTLHAHTKRLAPYLPNADAAFVRAGLFHWYELSPGERREVIAAARPLMQSPGVFEQLYRPLWQLTRDIGILRRISPPSLPAISQLKRLAIDEGLFDHYRELREQERQHRVDEARRLAQNGRTAELFGLLPAPVRVEDHEVVELSLRSFSSHAGRLDDLRVPLHAITYVLRHRVVSAGALKRILADPYYPGPLRARLALALGATETATRIETSGADVNSPEWVNYYLERAIVDARAGRADASEAALNRAAGAGLTESLLRAAAEAARILGQSSKERQYRADLTPLSGAKPLWRGTCGENELCTDASVELADSTALTVELTVVQTDEVPPYVEIYVDDRLVHEAAVTANLRLPLDLGGRGNHVIDLHIANPRTRSGLQRRLRIS